MNTVISKLEVTGATVTRHSDIFVEIVGLDGTPDEEMVDAGTVKDIADPPTSDTAWKNRILNFDLG
ncbi:MAG: hypothetical protein RRZ66_12115, partial [Bacteroidales bacterium]